jgi:F-type H+-transporting ATPase subunit b
MLIDWFTVLAQVVNFLILVWLLKRFLYRPILDAIDAREKRIAKELADADAKKAEAQKERDEFQHKNEAFEQQRAALLSKATDEAKAERQRLLDEARQAADALAAKRQEALRGEQQSLNEALSRRAREEVFAIARRALGDLATTSLEERMAEVFIRRLREMDAKAKAGLGEALKSASAPGIVRSAFELPAEQRTMIHDAINETFSADIHILFETAPDLVSGIELATDGQKVGWSIAEYLASLEKGVEELLQEKAKDQARTQAQAKKPSDLSRRIGKRAYELYEEHGRKDGLAAQDWTTAESEIRKEISNPVKSEPAPEAKAEPKPEAKAEPEPKEKAEPKPEVKAELKPEAKVEPKPDAKVEPKPEVKAEPKSEPKAEPKPEAKAEPTSEEPKPEAKGQ